jgi:hypothetical protein
MKQSLPLSRATCLIARLTMTLDLHDVPLFL